MLQKKTPPVATDTSLPGDTREERFIGVIHDAFKRKGLAGKEIFSIVVTNKYLLFIPLTPQRMKGKTASAKQSSGGFPLQKYLRLSVPALLSENPKNFALEISQIKSVNVIPGRDYYDCCRKHHEEDGGLEIVTSNATYSFSLPFPRVQTARDVLRKVNLP